MIALSWSRLKDFQECPKKFHLKYIAKSFPPEDQKSIHLVKGTELHKQMEDYILAKNGQAIMPLGFSPEVRQTLPYADKLFENFDEVFPEAQVACKQDWSADEWFGKQVAWRCIADVTAVRRDPARIFVGDWKSGKVYPYGDGFGQLHLSAIIMLQRFANMERVNSAYIYMEHKVIENQTVTRDPTDEVDSKGKPIPHLAVVRQHFETEFDKVQMEKNFDPTPNNNCKWCPATRMQCKFSRKL